jgi:hypothetical protein
MALVQVLVEAGSKRVCAAALDWPGWLRFATDEAGALAALAGYAPRYEPVAKEAGLELPPVTVDGFDVVERLPGSATTDFGAPDAVARRDTEPLGPDEAERITTLVSACWSYFDRVVAAAPADLRKGPRGGGRDRDKMVAHVLGAESAYVRKLGHRLDEPAVGDAEAISTLRRVISQALGTPSDGRPLVERGWPQRYAARRIAWHVLDHAWEMQDRSQPA